MSEAAPLKRYRMLVRCQMDGQLRDPGYITVKPADWIGPHRTVISQHETVHVGKDARRIPLTGRDEPLYEEVIDETAAEAAPAPIVAEVAPPPADAYSDKQKPPQAVIEQDLAPAEPKPDEA